jgi:hypothetical protein
MCYHSCVFNVLYMFVYGFDSLSCINFDNTQIPRREVRLLEKIKHRCHIMTRNAYIFVIDLALFI